MEYLVSSPAHLYEQITYCDDDEKETSLERPDINRRGKLLAIKKEEISDLVVVNNVVDMVGMGPGQRRKPLKCNNSREWTDIEIPLKIAAPIILLVSLSSFTISTPHSHITKMLSKIVPQLRRLQVVKPKSLVAMYSSSGGDAGAINAAGGTFAKKEQAQEAAYFIKLQHEQIAKLKSSIQHEIEHHEQEIKRHQEAIEKHKKSSRELEKNK